MTGSLSSESSIPSVRRVGRNSNFFSPDEVLAQLLPFLSAMRFVARRDKIAVPADTSVESTIGFGAIPTGFGIEAELRVSLHGMPRHEAEALVGKAHVVCPYSNATRGNIDVRLIVL